MDTLCGVTWIVYIYIKIEEPVCAEISVALDTDVSFCIESEYHKCKVR